MPRCPRKSWKGIARGALVQWEWILRALPKLLRVGGVQRSGYGRLAGIAMPGCPRKSWNSIARGGLLRVGRLQRSGQPLAMIRPHANVGRWRRRPLKIGRIPMICVCLHVYALGALKQNKAAVVYLAQASPRGYIREDSSALLLVGWQRLNQRSPRPV